MDRDSSVIIATCYGMDGLGIEYQWGVRYSAPVQNGSTQHPIKWVPGLFPRDKKGGAWR
jgi:hypothetical protein